MPNPCTGTGSEARQAAFVLAFRNSRSPLLYEDHTDEEIVPLIRERVPTASDDGCRDAIVTVRCLCTVVYEVCEKFRSGGFGAGEDAVQNALDALCDKVPGFSFEEYREAFAAGMLWTAF